MSRGAARDRGRGEVGAREEGGGHREPERESRRHDERETQRDRQTDRQTDRERLYVSCL